MPIDQPRTNLLARDGEMYFVPDAIAPNDAARHFARLRRDIAFERFETPLYGRRIKLPRGQAWFGDRAYRYAGMVLPPAAMPECLLPMKAVAEHYAGDRLNGVLANLYETGRDSVDWHADDETKVIGPVIASVSLGGTRRFRVKHLSDKGLRFGLDLPAGSVLIMAGTMQQHWHHCVPKAARAEPRINLTFRRVAVGG